MDEVGKWCRMWIGSANRLPHASLHIPLNAKMFLNTGKGRLNNIFVGVGVER